MKMTYELEYFQRWAANEGFSLQPNLGDTSLGKYHSRETQAAYEGWIARKKFVDTNFMECGQIFLDPLTSQKQIATYFENGSMPKVGTKIFVLAPPKEDGE